MLLWLSQLGLCVVIPPVITVFAASWLRSVFGWGNWACWIGFVAGILSAWASLRSALKRLNEMSKNEINEDSTYMFHDHE